MIKSAIALAAAAPLMAAPALAGPYVNVEANSGFAGGDYTGTTTEIAVGYAGATEGGVSYYVQAGPAIVSADGEDAEGAFTGKAGASIPVSEALSVYGEVSFAAVDGADETGYGTKIGATWNF